MALPGPEPTRSVLTFGELLRTHLRDAEVQWVLDSIEEHVQQRLAEQAKRLREELTAQRVAAVPAVPVAKEGCPCPVCVRRRDGW